MYQYVYEEKQKSMPAFLSIFFHQTNEEKQKIIHYSAIIAAQSMAVVLLLLFNSYLNLPTEPVQAYIPNNGAVAGVETTLPSPTPTVEPTPAPLVELKPTGIIKEIRPLPPKKSYTIAVYGDSMVDTMGEVLEYLDDSLHQLYPQTDFLLYNYGIGNQNVIDGLDRYYERLDYQNRRYPPLPEIKPDIIVIGSFAYNLFTPHDRNKHWLELTRLVQEAQKTGSQVYMLAEIAPLRADFGKGPQGVNWETQTVIEHSGRIIEQLENVIGLSRTLNVPLIDAYTPSLIEGKKEGKREFVSHSDGIHPSVKGHAFMADIIAKTIDIN